MNTLDDRMLNDARKKKIELAKDYDKSEGVNSFELNGKLVWLDKATRVGLMNSLKIEQSVGRSETELWLAGEAYTMSIEKAVQLLEMLEIYAKDCYNMTERHIANINALTDSNRVHNYNYTTGYPERLRIKV